MDYFLSIGGERSGPCTQFQLIERIREGSLKGNELAWRKGAPEWQPLKSMEEFAPYWPITEEQVAQAAEARRLARVAMDTPQPWLRFWARMVDYVWFATALQLTFGSLLPDEKLVFSGGNEAQIIAIAFGCVTLMLFAPLEAWCISRYGTTPGKALLRIQVRRQDGGLPSFHQTMRRSLLVYIKGVALGLTLPALFTMSYCRMRLLQTGATSWDHNCQTRVEHGEPEVWRFLVLVALIFLIVAAAAVTMLLMSHEMMDNLRSRLPK
jgi:uncharacterized RDD family membrane protein YckC